MRSARGSGLSRRTFLKLSVVGGLAARLAPDPSARPAIASNLPLPFPHRYFPDADAWLAHPQWDAYLAVFDVWLVPAYAAATLIQRGALRALTGERFAAPGRAHDPDGAFTLPYAYAVSALLSGGAGPQSLADLWRAEWQADAVWPDAVRLVMGAALLRRGYSPNDAHSGHLAEIEKDLCALRPRLAADPTGEVRRGAASLALAPVTGLPARAPGLTTVLPVEGALLIEYDWVIPSRTPNATAALAFLRQAAKPAGIGESVTVRLAPLAPLPTEALARRAAIWARVCHASATRPTKLG